MKASFLPRIGSFSPRLDPQQRSEDGPVSREELMICLSDFAITTLEPALCRMRDDMQQIFSAELYRVLRGSDGTGNRGTTASAVIPRGVTPHVPAWLTDGTSWSAVKKGRLSDKEGGAPREHEEAARIHRPFTPQVSFGGEDEHSALVPGERPLGLPGEFVFIGSESTFGSARDMDFPHDGVTRRSVLSQFLPCGSHQLKRLEVMVTKSQTFDACVGMVVLSNAMFIGIETDYLARHLGEPLPDSFLWVDILFFAVFGMELTLRMLVLRCKFFLSQDWKWNTFDFTVVALQAFEILSKVFLATIAQSNFSFLRLMRMLRLLRIIRLGRLLHLIVELRSMVSSIIGSFSSLCWALLLFMMLIYTFGVFFTQMVTERREEIISLGHSETSALLEEYYGNLSVTVLGLWACISGGTDWSMMLQPLMSEVSALMPIVFVAYTAFCILAMMNVVTGIFVQKSVSSAEADQAMCVVRNVIEVFEKTELNENGEITWAAFEEKLKSKEVKNLFDAVNIHESDAFGLFRLIDVDDSGAVGPEEFLNGWVRLRGPAKSVDLAILMREQERLTKYLHNKLESMEEQLIQSGRSRAFDLGPENASSSDGRSDSAPEEEADSFARKQQWHAMRRQSCMSMGSTTQRGRLRPLRASICAKASSVDFSSNVPSGGQARPWDMSSSEESEKLSSDNGEAAVKKASGPGGFRRLWKSTWGAE